MLHSFYYDSLSLSTKQIWGFFFQIEPNLHEFINLNKFSFCLCSCAIYLSYSVILKAGVKNSQYVEIFSKQPSQKLSSQWPEPRPWTINFYCVRTFLKCEVCLFTGAKKRIHSPVVHFCSLSQYRPARVPYFYFAWLLTFYLFVVVDYFLTSNKHNKWWIKIK